MRTHAHTHAGVYFIDGCQSAASRAVLTFIQLYAVGLIILFSAFFKKKYKKGGEKKHKKGGEKKKK